MQSSAFWSAPAIAGTVAACGLYIILIMMLMCIIMYSKQRKKAYLYMVITFVFIMTYEGLNIHFAFNVSPHATDYPEWARWLRVLSFLLMNASIYQLYRRMNRIGYLLLTSMILLLFIPIVSTVLPLGGTGWQDLYLDIYQIAIVYIGLSVLAPRIGQRGKYVAGISVYLFYIVIEMIARYTHMDVSWLQAGSLLLPLVYYTVVFFILFERIIELMQSIYRSSITDGLTNLYNRRFFTKQLQKYIDQGIKVSVIFCDIDNFKNLNDTQGHAKADLVLKQVAAIMEEEIYGMGITGRYGGEELVALVVDKRAKVGQVAENIRARVEGETIVTMSIGHSTLRMKVPPEELVSQADQAMYQSKTSGKNKVTSYRSPSTNKKPEESVTS
ncbi:sensor domain-containing diguanylate cyclase [Paenibacillus pini]